MMHYSISLVFSYYPLVLIEIAVFSSFSCFSVYFSGTRKMTELKV